MTGGKLRDLDDIAAAGADAVQGWRLSDQQCEQVAACVAVQPVIDRPTASVTELPTHRSRPAVRSSQRAA